MKLINPIVKKSPAVILRERVEAGNLDTEYLRKSWHAIFNQAGGEIWSVGTLVGHPVVYCDRCGKPCFAAKTKSAYGGARWICEDECLNKYAYCEPCRTYIMVEDLGNPTHTHEGRQNPGYVHFPGEVPVAVYNADIMANGAQFYKTPTEIQLLNRRRLTSTNPERVFRNFGVEIEVEKLPGGPPDILTRTRNLLNEFVMIKRDGSLSRNGNGGFEIVAAPATLAYHKGGAWMSFFKHLGPFFQESPPTTGIHVHIGLNTLLPLTVDKMILFCNAKENREFVFGMANRNLQRKNPNGRAYAQVKDWSPGEMMRLKQHSGHCPWHPQNRGRGNYYKVIDGEIQVDPFGNPIIAKTISSSPTVRATCKCAEGNYKIDHYEAVNLRTNRPTVELRIFRGVVNESFLYACLEFADSIADFCAQTSISDLHYKNYIEFLKNKTKRYNNLYRLLVNQCWIDPPKDKPKTEALAKVPTYGVYA
jgi:hypothetical protein